MSPDDFDSRLRHVELSLIELFTPVASTLRNIEKIVARHDAAIFGRPDDRNSLGIDKRIDRLEQGNKLRVWVFGLVLGSLLTTGAQTLAHYFGVL